MLTTLGDSGATTVSVNAVVLLLLRTANEYRVKSRPEYQYDLSSAPHGRDAVAGGSRDSDPAWWTCTDRVRAWIDAQIRRTDAALADIAGRRSNAGRRGAAAAESVHEASLKELLGQQLAGLLDVTLAGRCGRGCVAMVAT